MFIIGALGRGAFFLEETGCYYASHPGHGPAYYLLTSAVSAYEQTISSFITSSWDHKDEQLTE